MVTMKEIAEECGVARSTVSYALNDRYVPGINIPEQTRKRVKEVANACHYYHNEVARSIKKKKTNVVAFYLPSLKDEYVARTLEGFFIAAQEKGYIVKLFCHEADQESAVGKIISQRPAGIIAWTPTAGFLENLDKCSSKYGIPVMLLGSFPQVSWARGVAYDDFAGSAKAVTYLFEKGHRRILHLAGPQQLAYARGRKVGFVKAMNNRGLPCGEDDIIESPHPYFNESLGEAELSGLLREKFSSSNKPTAIFCASDFIALQAIRILSRLGKKIPEDISIVGYGDLQIAKYANPSLTTIAQPYEEAGAYSFESLLRIIETGRSQKKTKLFNVVLVERQSVKDIS